MTDDQAVWLVPGEGTHLLRHGRTWLWLDRSQDTRSGAPDRQGRDRETLKIHALAFRRGVLTALVADILRSHGQRAGTIGLHTATSYGEWSELGRINRRPLNSVFVPGGLAGNLLADGQRRAHAGKLGAPYPWSALPHAK